MSYLQLVNTTVFTKKVNFWEASTTFLLFVKFVIISLCKVLFAWVGMRKWSEGSLRLTPTRPYKTTATPATPTGSVASRPRTP